MKPDRLQRIEVLYHSALEREPGERGAFLADACQGDQELRGEVESLLRQGGSWLNSPAWERAPSLMDAPTPAALTPGAQLGPYKIEAQLGAGDMGEVFLAADSRLHRTVAIKTLPRHMVADPERKHRFMQEARAASALNHPHIVTIHDIGTADGTDFIVMEHVAGKTLGN